MSKCKYGGKSFYWDDDLQEEVDYIECDVQFELAYDGKPYCGTDYECTLDDEEVKNCPIYKLQQENEQLKEQIKDIDMWMTKYNEEFDKNKKLENNWNELKKWIIETFKLYVPIVRENSNIAKIIDKMNELERGVSNE